MQNKNKKGGEDERGVIETVVHQCKMRFFQHACIETYSSTVHKQNQDFVKRA